MENTPKRSTSWFSFTRNGQKIGVHYVTVFRMRHKLLHFIEMIVADDSIGAIAEIDEKHILASHKGTKLEGVDPRTHG